MTENEQKELIIKGTVVSFLVSDAIAITHRLSGGTGTNVATIDMLPGPGQRDAGTYSNSAALALCEMASLNEFNTINYDDIMDRFHDCYIGGYLNWDIKDDSSEEATTTYFLGETSIQAIKNYSNGMPTDKCGLHDEDARDGEGLMRLMPIGLFFLHEELPQFIKICHDTIQLTHNSIHNHVCAVLYALILRNFVLNKAEKVFEIVAEYYTQQNMTEHLSALSEIKQADAPATSSNNVIQTFWTGWRIFSSNEHNYKNCIARAVRLGGDCNVVAAIAGSLNGIVNGVNDIPSNWLRTLKLTPEVMETIEIFCKKIVAKI